jgi:SAM-dependent methyltransferase
MMLDDDPAAYGDAFADVYDDWYSTISDVEATVETVLDLAAGGPILELGVGTGRLGIPLARRGAKVCGIDASTAMLDILSAKPGSIGVDTVRADMAALPLAGRFAVAFVAFNTFFNLLTELDQQRCAQEVARNLAPNGCFVVEAFVPSAEPAGISDGQAERSDGVGGLVVTTTRRDPASQTVRGVHTHTDASGSVRERPWAIRYLHPHQLDELCRGAGLELEHRWAGFDRAGFDAETDRHVSIYRLA